MKKLLFLVTCIFFAPLAISADLTPKQIVDKSYSGQSADYEFQRVRMTIYGKNNKVKESREYVSYSKSVGSEFKYIQVFHSPRGMRGTTNLTISNDEQTNRWVYLPHLNKNTIQRVGKSRKSAKSKVMDTDIANEDLKVLRKQDFEYTHNEKMEKRYKERGEDVYVIEVRPISDSAKANSSYSMRRYHIQKENYLLNRLDYFDQFKKYIKYQVNEGYFKTKLGTFKPRVSVMMSLNKANRHQVMSATKIETLSASQSNQEPPGWTDNIFTFRSILNGDLLQNNGEIIKWQD